MFIVWARNVSDESVMFLRSTRDPINAGLISRTCYAAKIETFRQAKRIADDLNDASMVHDLNGTHHWSNGFVFGVMPVLNAHHQNRDHAAMSVTCGTQGVSVGA